MEPFLLWIIAGDFNAILSLDEKRGETFHLDPCSDPMRDNVASMNLVDIKPLNGVFPWDNRTGDAAISERLDRFFMSSFWVGDRWMSSSKILYWWGSDYWPIKLSTYLARSSKRQYFKFQLMWL